LTSYNYFKLTHTRTHARALTHTHTHSDTRAHTRTHTQFI